MATWRSDRRRGRRNPETINIRVRHGTRSLNMYSRICTPSRMLCDILRIARAMMPKREIIADNDHHSGVKSLLTPATNMDIHLEE
jgi:hypothetical protein